MKVKQGIFDFVWVHEISQLRQKQKGREAQGRLTTVNKTDGASGQYPAKKQSNKFHKQNSS